MNITLIPPTTTPDYKQFLEDLTFKGHHPPSPELIQFFYALNNAGYSFYVPPAGYWYDFKVEGSRIDFMVAQTNGRGLYQIDPANNGTQLFDYNQQCDRIVEYVVVACWNNIEYRLDFYLFDATHVPTSFGLHDECAAAGKERWKMFCEAPAKLKQLIPDGMLAAFPEGIRPVGYTEAAWPMAYVTTI